MTEEDKSLIERERKEERDKTRLTIEDCEKAYSEGRQQGWDDKDTEKQRQVDELKKWINTRECFEGCGVCKEENRVTIKKIDEIFNKNKEGGKCSIKSIWRLYKKWEQLKTKLMNTKQKAVSEIYPN